MQSHKSIRSNRLPLDIEARGGYDFAVPFRAIGQNIRRLRQAKGLQASTLAEQVGVKPSNLSKWERRTPTRLQLQTLIRLASTLRVSLDALVAGVDVTFDNQRAQAHLEDHADLSADEREVLMNYRNAPEEVKPVLRQMLAAARGIPEESAAQPLRRAAPR